MQDNTDTGFLDEEFNKAYKKILERDSVKVPMLYDGDLWKLERGINDLQYLFDKAYEKNQNKKENEELDRLSQMTTIYLSSAIYDLREYQKELEQYLNCIHMEDKKVEDKTQEAKDWYTEFKGEENE